MAGPATGRPTLGYEPDLPPGTIIPAAKGAKPGAVGPDIQNTTTNQEASGVPDPGTAPAADDQKLTPKQKAKQRQAAQFQASNRAAAGPFANMVFTAWDPSAALQLQGKASTVAIQVNEDGSCNASPAQIQALRDAGFTIVVWQAMATAAGVATAKAIGAAGYIAQAEGPDQLAAARAVEGDLGSMPRALVTNNFMDTYPPGWVAMPEAYQNNNPQATPSGVTQDAKNRGATVVVPVLALNSENNNAIGIDAYHDLSGLDVPGYGAWLAEEMTPADVANFGSLQTVANNSIGGTTPAVAGTPAGTSGAPGAIAGTGGKGDTSRGAPAASQPLDQAVATAMLARADQLDALANQPGTDTAIATSLRAQAAALRDAVAAGSAGSTPGVPPGVPGPGGGTGGGAGGAGGTGAGGGAAGGGTGGRGRGGGTGGGGTGGGGSGGGTGGGTGTGTGTGTSNPAYDAAFGDYLFQFGMPPDLQAKITAMMQAGKSPLEIISYIRGTDWYAKTYPGISEGISKGVITNERDYRAMLNEVSGYYQRYLGRNPTAMEFASALSQGYTAQIVGKQLEGHAYGQVYKNDINYVEGAFGNNITEFRGQPRNQPQTFSDQQLDVYGQQQVGLGSAMGLQLNKMLDEAVARYKGVFQGVLAAPGMQLGSAGLSAPSLGGAKAGGGTSTDVPA